MMMSDLRQGQKTALTWTGWRFTSSDTVWVLNIPTCVSPSCTRGTRVMSRTSSLPRMTSKEFRPFTVSYAFYNCGSEPGSKGCSCVERILCGEKWQQQNDVAFKIFACRVSVACLPFNPRAQNTLTQNERKIQIFAKMEKILCWKLLVTKSFPGSEM